MCACNQKSCYQTIYVKRLEDLLNIMLMDDHLLFQSIRTHKELSRQQAYRIIHHAAEELGLCHID